MLCGEKFSASEPGITGNERCPPGEKRSRWPEGVAQVHVLTASSRALRGKLRVRHRPGERQHDGAGGNRTRESGDEGRPAGQKGRDRPERGAQVHVLSSRARSQRRKFRVGHRAGKREHPARHPGGQEQHRARHGRGDLGRREQDAAADDVGNDERRRVERTEAAFERLRWLGGRRHPGILTTKVTNDTKNTKTIFVVRDLRDVRVLRGYSVRSWRSI